MDARIIQFFKDNFGKPYSEIAPKLKKLFDKLHKMNF